ncbi:fibronectin type III domain-containing protein [Dyadobacter sp. CY261]|uniref:fibronectin type III domain-containing protein n=1 Tax=Dyadobacter sp. CY261 TaxID=2907203 RepID=UPI001F3587C2|nr:fibronectin type III domain-containing protein [Dyadobacter sp. CY261]MCF0069024.1 fibronectin type III domain-containing protein [Dyadobacter sp. CY261]
MNSTFTRRLLSFVVLHCLVFATPCCLWAAIPKAPATLTAVAFSSSQINLAWADASADETGFEVEQSTDGIKFTRIADLPANTVIYLDKPLKPATRYWYRARAKNASGASAYSNIANATTQQVAPVAPSNLTATAVSTSQIDLKWTDNASNETGYQIERSLNGTTFLKIADLTANVTTYESTGLTPATDYHFRVRAVNAMGASAYSNVSSVKTQNIPVPDVPTNLTAVPTAPDLIKLRWAKLAGNATEVMIERAKGEEEFVQIAKLQASVLQYEDKSELENADYFYRIKARNAGGDSPYSLIAIVRAASIITAAELPNDQHRIYAAGRTLIVSLNRVTNADVWVYDMAGRLHKEQIIGQTAHIDLAALPTGLYIVVTDTGKEVTSKRILLY